MRVCTKSSQWFPWKQQLGLQIPPVVPAVENLRGSSGPASFPQCLSSTRVSLMFQMFQSSPTASSVRPQHLQQCVKQLQDTWTLPHLHATTSPSPRNSCGCASARWGFTQTCRPALRSELLTNQQPPRKQAARSAVRGRGLCFMIKHLNQINLRIFNQLIEFKYGYLNTQS